MKDKLIKNYVSTKRLVSAGAISTDSNTFLFSYLDGPRVEILGNCAKEYSVYFIDQDDNKLIYNTTLNNNMWAAATIKYYVNWKIVVKCGEEIVAQDTINLRNKKVKILLDTRSMGDLIAYIGAVEEFRKRHECELHCVVLFDGLIKIFERTYSNIRFVGDNDADSKYYSVYRVGFFVNWNGMIKSDPKNLSLANISACILGLGMVEYRPNLSRGTHTKKKRVCIATQSTAQCKYWQNEHGWEPVIRYLNSMGYEVWCIDRDSVFGNQVMNSMPRGAIDKTGNLPLETRIEQLSESEFFIGLSSGLSWLAWAVGIPVVLVSGFTHEWNEFFTPYRVINKSVCHGCFNQFEFDKSNWMWCPKNKNFECNKNITSDMVLSQVNIILGGGARTATFDWGIETTPQKYVLHTEFFSSNKTIYERFFEVERGDVVVDVGAHIGSFSCAVSKKGPKRIVSMEPSPTRFLSLKNNVAGLGVEPVNKAISGEKAFVQNGLSFNNVVEDLDCMTFHQFIKEYGLQTIDFLKVDCEGGEYEIFTEKNISWIKNNVKKIAGEFHLEDREKIDKFIKFRDTILGQFDNYRIESVDGVDIKWRLFDPSFVEYYKEIMVFIDNRKDFVGTTINVPQDVVTVVSTHANNEHRKSVLKRCLSNIKTKVILSTNFPVDEETQRLCDYVIYDKINPLLYKGEFESHGVGFFWIMQDGSTKPFEYEHGYAEYKLICNGLELANSLGYKYVHFQDYDFEISESRLRENERLLKEYDCVVFKDIYPSHGEHSCCSAFFSANVQKILPVFRKYKNKLEYYKSGAGRSQFVVLEIKLFLGLIEQNLKIKELLYSDLEKENKTNLVKDIH